MKITTVTVRYGELKSTGFPSFSNKRVEVEMSAELQPGETARGAKEKLLMFCKAATLEALGETPSAADEVDIPF